MIDVSRRSFLKLSGSSVTGSAIATIGVNAIPVQAASFKSRKLKTLNTKETTTICPFCAVGCGLIVSTAKGKVVSIEGDPDHPINKGSLCSKGMALYQVGVNERRLQKVKYRAPGSKKWEEKEWGWALTKIAQNIKKTRDETLVVNETDGSLVNRTNGIACLGGAALDNEEAYLYSKLSRAMGITYLEHQARI